MQPAASSTHAPPLSASALANTYGHGYQLLREMGHSGQGRTPLADIEKAAQVIPSNLPANKSNLIIGKQGSLYRRPSGLWRIKQPEGCGHKGCHWQVASIRSNGRE
eukprot:6206411-Amphidinium_carterae.1